MPSVKHEQGPKALLFALPLLYSLTWSDLPWWYFWQVLLQLKFLNKGVNFSKLLVLRSAFRVAGKCFSRLSLKLPPLIIHVFPPHFLMKGLS